MRLFRVLYVLSPDRDERTGSLYVTKHFLCGEEAAAVGSADMPLLGAACGDADGDGKYEAVLIDGLPYSSWAGLAFGAYSLKDGRPELFAGNQIDIGTGATVELVSHNGRLCYVHAGSEYELSLKNGVFCVDDPKGLLKFEYRGPWPMVFAEPTDGPDE